MIETEEAQSVVKADQHTLIDESVIKQIVDKADIKSSDIVLEIGAGSGNVTAELAKCCKKLFILEKDQDLLEILADRFENNGNVRILAGDVLQIELPNFNKIVSNMPYSILQQFFMRLIKERKQNFEQAVMIVPYGFAKKMTATPDSNDFGMVSALFMAFYDVDMFAQIEKSSFDPQPRVTSVCVSIKPKNPSLSQSKTTKLLQNLFINNDRKVRNSLLHSLWDEGQEVLGKKLTKNEAEALVDKIMAGLPKPLADKKGVTLTNDEFRRLVTALLSLEQKQSI